MQSTVQLGLDFLFPESVGEALRLAEEIRCLPNDHEAKLQVLEVQQSKTFISFFSLPTILFFSFSLFHLHTVSSILYKLFLLDSHVQVGKVSLYAASSSIKEIQKLVLDPK